MATAFASQVLIEDADMSSSFQSEPISLHKKIGYSIHSVFTGSPNGSLFLAVSINGVDYIILTDSIVAITEAGEVCYNVADVNYLWARLHYTATSGTGALDAKFSAKEGA